MFRSSLAFAAVLALVVASPTQAATLKCPRDSIKVGNVCVDTYEASVWMIAPSNTSLVKLVQTGKATAALLIASGAVQLGCTGAPFNLTAYPANFPADANWTPVLGSVPPSPGVYAVSVAGVLPSSCITWFQANQACGVSGKRLIRNDVRPCITILDWSMPGIDGRGFLLARRETRTFGSLPVVVLSASTTACQEARQYGIEACFTKPLDPEKIAAFVERYCDRAAAA